MWVLYIKNGLHIKWQTHEIDPINDWMLEKVFFFCGVLLEKVLKMRIFLNTYQTLNSRLSDFYIVPPIMSFSLQF